MRIAKLLTAMLLLCASFSLSAQFEYKNSFWGGHFYHQNEKLKFSEAEQMIMKVPDAHRLYKKGKKLRTYALVSGVAGLGMAGVDLALILSDEDNNTLPYSIGVLGFSILTLYLETQKTKQFNNAAYLYNRGKTRPVFASNRP